MIISSNLFLIKNNEILLSLRMNTGFSDGDYSIVGGHLEKNETVHQAAVREAREEIGITIDPKHLKFAFVLHGNPESERIHFFFTTNKWGGEITNTEPDKCGDLRWFPLDALPQNIVSGTKFAIEKFCAGEQYSEFGW